MRARVPVVCLGPQSVALCQGMTHGEGSVRLRGVLLSAKAAAHGGVGWGWGMGARSASGQRGGGLQQAEEMHLVGSDGLGAQVWETK